MSARCDADDITFIISSCGTFSRFTVLRSAPCTILDVSARVWAAISHSTPFTRLLGIRIPRTQRNQNTAALVKDRHSRSGLNHKSETMHRGGAGAHNWGSYHQAGTDEIDADADARRESDADAMNNAQVDDAENEATQDEPLEMDGVGPLPKDMVNGKGEKVPENKDFMRDATGIATSPSDSMSSFDSLEAAANNHKMNKPARRMSNVSDEERERARLYREGVMHKPKGCK